MTFARKEEVVEDLDQLRELEPAPRIPVNYHFSQRLLQFAYRLETAVGASSFVLQNVKQLPYPWASMLEMAAVPAAAIGIDMARELTIKPDPLEKLRADGNGNRAKGLVKHGVTKFVAIGIVVAAGYGVGRLTLHMMTDPPSTHSPEHMHFMQALKDYHPLIFGGFGFFTYEGLHAIGMRLWQNTIPSRPEAFKDRQVNIFQAAGNEILHNFLALASAETIFDNMKVGGKVKLATDHLFQAGIASGTYVANRFMEYFGFQPHPIDSLVPLENRQPREDIRTDLMRDVDWEPEQRVKPSTKQILVSGGAKASKYAAFLLVTMLIADLISELHKAHHVPTEDRFSFRMKHIYAVVFAVNAALFLASYSAQPVLNRGTRYWNSMFPPTPRKPLEGDPLLGTVAEQPVLPPVPPRYGATK